MNVQTFFETLAAIIGKKYGVKIDTKIERNINNGNKCK